MTEAAFDKIKAELDSAQAYLEGSANKGCYRVHMPEATDETKAKEAPAADDPSPSS